MKRTSLLTVFLPLLFLMPLPILGQTVITGKNTLTQDHIGNIIIGNNGVTLDCDGHSVIGTPGIGVGILLNGRMGVTVKNCHVEGFNIGFLITDGSHNNKFEYNTSIGSGIRGFQLDNSNKNKLHYNTAEGGGVQGFALFHSDDNTLEYNTAMGNGNHGFQVNNSDDNELEYNTAIGNNNGFNLFQSDKNEFEGNTATGNDNGFNLFMSDENEFEDNTANENDTTGFVAASSDENEFEGNTANENGNNGFGVGGTSEQNTLEENKACDNAGFDALDISTGSGNEWDDNDFCFTSLPDDPLEIKISVNNLDTGEPIRQRQTDVVENSEFQVTVRTNGIDCAGQIVVTALGAPTFPPSVLVQSFDFIIGPFGGSNSALFEPLFANGFGNVWKISASCNGAVPQQFAFDSFEFLVEP